MKYLLISLFLCFSFNIHSQDNNEYYEILYESSSMIRNTYKQPKKAYMNLYVQGDNSIYQWETERQLDSIRAKREITDEEFSRYFSIEHYAIEIEKNKLKYYEVIGDVEYQYEEEISYKWALKPDTRTINGYNCKKATTTYGGRDWIAWYAIDLPINAGPYKFKGLPGLILKINDSTNSYDFTIVSLKTKKKLLLKKLFHHSNDKNRVIVDRMTYNAIRFTFKSLSFQERMKLLNKQEGIINKMVFTNNDGTDANPFKDQRNVERSKHLNFIEIDHDK